MDKHFLANMTIFFLYSNTIFRHMVALLFIEACTSGYVANSCTMSLVGIAVSHLVKVN